MGAKTRNLYRGALVAFCNWCIVTNRLAVNPVHAVAKANEKADRRRQRRSMTEPELVTLLAVARERPLREALTVRKGPRKGERYANVRPEVRERLDWLGRERALIYKTLVLTGLRKGELSSLTVAHLCLDGPIAFLALDAPTKRTGRGTPSPSETTSPRTCATGSPTNCAAFKPKPWRRAHPYRPGCRPIRPSSPSPRRWSRFSTAT